MQNLHMDHQMDTSNGLPALILAKLHEQDDRTEHLLTHIPTVFVPEGEALLTLLLGNLEHFINHKYQLFAYLKMLGVPLGSRDLYVWRGR